MSTRSEEVAGVKSRLGGLSRRLETADLGSLPIVLGLSVIWLIFWLANDKFLSPLNLTNLMLQIAALGTLATGIFLVLLLGGTMQVESPVTGGTVLQVELPSPYPSM